jgi:alkanesulfonate monooxygenase SsuD/methylene tetrahydromethanopterin reductase-like flavin-dependent oxidoreductase (luciferase family)
MICGGGEQKTLRMVAQYGDACNLFAGADEARKLGVLRRHCEALGRDYDTIYKTAYYFFDPSRGTQRIVDDLGALAALGFNAAIGAVSDLWDVTPLEVIGSEVIPAVADL